jgi:hypothetical protein
MYVCFRGECCYHPKKMHKNSMLILNIPMLWRLFSVSMYIYRQIERERAIYVGMRNRDLKGRERDCYSKEFNNLENIFAHGQKVSTIILV